LGETGGDKSPPLAMHLAGVAHFGNAVIKEGVGSIFIGHHLGTIFSTNSYIFKYLKKTLT